MIKRWNWEASYYALAGLGIAGIWMFCSASSVDRYAGDLRKYLSFAKEVKVERVGNLIVVQGEASSSPEWEQINEVVTSMNTTFGEKAPFRVLNRVDLSSRTKQILISEIEKQIGNPSISVKTLGPAILLQGTADNDYEADRSIELTRLIIQRDLPLTQIANVKDIPNRQVSSATKARWPEMIVDMLKVKPKK